MTARRRKRSRSGPSATVLIAWAGGEGVGADLKRAYGARSALKTPAHRARASMLGRGRGLAVGTLLACGSVLAVAVHAADSSSSPTKSDPPSGLVTASPDAVSGRAGTTQLAVSHSTTPHSATASSSLGSPARADNHLRSGPVVRNTPLALDSLSESSAAEVEQAQLLSWSGAADQPAETSGPVERMTAPLTQTLTTVEQAVAPVTQVSAPTTEPSAPASDRAEPASTLIAPTNGEGTQPAMTMLSPLSWDESS